jgi:hypothetical protein
VTTQKPRKKVVREYKKDTFKAHQDSMVGKCEQSINEILEFLGKSELKFANITKLAKHISEMLQKGGNSCHFATLLRKRSTTKGAPNPYRLLLQKYQSGKYFVNVRSITAEDIEEIRKKYPAVDAYCSLKEGESKILQEQVKHLTREVNRLQESKVPSHGSSTTGELPAQLDKTVMALKRLTDAAADFLAIDWEKRAIVDISHRNPKVVVEPELLYAFFRALENSGMKPPEGA